MKPATVIVAATVKSFAFRKNAAHHQSSAKGVAYLTSTNEN